MTADERWAALLAWAERQYDIVSQGKHRQQSEWYESHRTAYATILMHMRCLSGESPSASQAAKDGEGT